MEAYKRKEDPSSPSSDGSGSSSYLKSSKRPPNDRKRFKWCKNNNHGRNVDCYHEEIYDGKSKNKFLIGISVNEENDSGLNVQDPTFVEQNQLPVNNCVNSYATGMQLMADRQMTAHSNSVVMNTFPYIGVHTQPNLPERMGMLGFCQYDGMSQQKDLLHQVPKVMYLNDCILYPPGPFIHIPSPRDKPIGCKIILITKLPENTTEKIIRDVFECCGKILSVHMTRNNFCYVCFASEDAVDKAICFSGYLMQIKGKNETEHQIETIYIDYAEAKDIHSQSQSKQEDFDQHTYLSVVPFSKETAINVVTKLKEECNFYEATTVGTKVIDAGSFYETLHTLIGWLVKGECVKSNADEFFTMIMTAQRLSETIQFSMLKFKEKKNEAESNVEEQVKNILGQFNLISKFFSAVRLQKVWDHFSKAQRKNIEKWQEEFEDIRNASSNELLQQRIEDDMDISDDETKIPDAEKKQMLAKELEVLEEKRKSLTHELEEKLKEKEKLKCDYLKYKSKIQHLEAVLNSPKPSVATVQHNINDNTTLNKQVHLISLISTFLSVHHFGASIDYICSYLQQFDSSLKTRDIESLMKNFPTIFNEKLSGIGASLEKKWTFCHFKSQMRH